MHKWILSNHRDKFGMLETLYIKFHIQYTCPFEKKLGPLEIDLPHLEKLSGYATGAKQPSKKFAEYKL